MAEWAITASVLILVVLILRQCLKGKISLRLQYGLWALVLLRLLIPFNFGRTELSVLNAVTIWPQPESSLSNFMADGAEETTPKLPVVEPDMTLQGHLPILGSENSQTFESETLELDSSSVLESKRNMREKPVLLEDILIVIWGSGAVGLGIWFLGVNIVFARKLRRNRKPLKIEKCPLPVYVTTVAQTPCLFGLLRPKLYVTPEVEADPTLLYHSMVHELTHFRHGDCLWALLRGVCLALHWYNPLVWLAAALSRQDGELCCDEATVRQLGEKERAAYGRTLLTVTCQKSSHLLLATTSMIGNGRDIKERIILLTRRPQTAVCTLAIVLLIAVAAVGGTFTGARETGKTNAPWDWARNITVEQLQEKNQGFDMELLTQILNSLERENFSSTSNFTGNSENWVVNDCVTQYSFALTQEEGVTCLNFGDQFWQVNSSALYEFVKTSLKNQNTKQITTADLDWDGVAEQIWVEEAEPLMYQLVVTKEDGTEVLREDAGLGHSAWNSLYLFTAPSSNLQYLLRYNPSMYTGRGHYRYALIHLEDGQWVTEQENEVDVDTWNTTVITPQLRNFADEVNRLLRHSSLLLSTQDANLIIGPEDVGSHLEELKYLGLEDGFTVANSLPIPADKPVHLQFCSGAGAWTTNLTLYSDGTFQGEYHDSDFDIVYLCTFRGRFGQIQQYHGHTYCLTLEELENTTGHSVGQKWTEDGVHFIASEPYGLEEGTEFLFYTPEVPTEELSSQFLSWFNGAYQKKEELQAGTGLLSYYGLYNRLPGYGFFSE
ncbi:MAG: M56 family metallopeptidase [Lawsonibacter sp.]